MFKKFYVIILVLAQCMMFTTSCEKKCMHTNRTLIGSTATCEKSGVSTFKCNDCGKEVQENAPALQHDFSIFVEDTSSCEKDGYIKYQCSKCSSTTTTEKKASGHKGIIKCSNCNSLYYDLICDIILDNHLYESTFSGADTKSQSRVTYTKGKNNEVCITLESYFDLTVSGTQSTTQFIIKNDGSWEYTINMVFTGAISSSGTLSGKLLREKLSSITSQNVRNMSVKLPVSSITNNEMVSVLYSCLVGDFCKSVFQFEMACFLNEKITMKELGFSNY